MKKLSKAKQLQIERQARKEARAEAKAKDAAQLARLKQRVEEMSLRPPQELAQWGSVRTQAFVKSLAIAQHKAGLKTIKADRLAIFVSAVEGIGTMPLDQCHQLSLLSDTAAHLE